VSGADPRNAGGPLGETGSLELPGELFIPLGFAPPTNQAATAATSAPTGHAPTPGMTSAVTRVPSGPTMPDWDPTSVGQAMLRMANELFQAPPGAAPGGTSGHAMPAPAHTMPAPAAPAIPTALTLPRAAPQAPQMAAPQAPPMTAPQATTAVAQPQLAMPSVPAAAAPAAMSPSAPPPLPDAAAMAQPFSIPLDLRAALRAMLPPPAQTAPLLDETQAAAPDPSVPYWLSAIAPTAAPTSHAARSAPLPSTELPAPPPASSLGSLLTLDGGAPYALARPSPTLEPFDAHAIRRQFPILKEKVHGRPLVWLDNAATTQKPQAVIDRLAYFYAHESSNIHRAAHTLAARATEAYEKARDAVRRFIGAASPEEIIFVRGATEGINLIAQTWARKNLAPGDEIVVTHLEHHANIVPWQQLAAERGVRLRVAPVDDRGQILLDAYERLLGPRTRLVAMTQVSNALGTITPAREMIELAHRRDIKVLLDGAQAVSHLRVDVRALDCDFYVLSGHKVFAPTGIGAVYAKRALLDDMPPWQGGGNMIADVTFERTTYQGPPARFEAGTGNIADAVGLGAALEWLSAIGLENVERHEHELLVYATERLAAVPGLTMIGTAEEKAGVLSFILAGQYTQEVGGLLDQEGIAVRSGHHCAQPILRRFGVEATVRASLAPYNTRDDIDALVSALHRLQARSAAPALRRP
jgi:cysteine desulfurase / selenocysteine lyase